MKILVIDDHPLVREAIAGILGQLSPAPTVLEAGDGTSALALARDHADANLMLLDLNLPGVRGFEALDLLRRAHPTLPIAILSMHHDRDSIRAALRRGATGFIPKSSPKQVIVNAIRLMLEGGVYVPAEMMSDESALTRDPLEFAPPARTTRSVADLSLTPRQGQVLALIMKGRSNKEICRELGLAERTVKVHVTAVLTALKVASRTQAVIAAGALGLNADAMLAVDAKD